MGLLPGWGCTDVAWLGRTKPPTDKAPGGAVQVGCGWVTPVEGSLAVLFSGLTGSPLETQVVAGKE